MLDEYRQLYEECANLIPDWKKLSKTELANLYIEHEQDFLANSYFSALICKFWNLISSYYYRQGIKVASEQDCYDWLITGITQALRQRVWKNPDNVLFNDPKGPEKAITICIMSDRANYYQYVKYDKRKLNYSSLSLDVLEENSSDGYFIPYYDTYISLTDYIVQLIKTKFEQQDYFFCFLVDAIMNFDIIIDNDKESYYNIDIKKFNKFVDNIDISYIEYFSNTYNQSIDIVKAASYRFKTIPTYMIYPEINRVITLLKHDEMFYSLLSGRFYVD